MEESFLKKLPNELNILLEKADSFGLKAYFVGGVTRDFLLFNTISNDIDIEFHHEEEISDEDFFALFNQFISYLKEENSVELLGKMVHQIKLGDVKVDFTIPRVEHFIPESHGHSNFDLSFGNYPLEMSSKRRDFTINAIYFKFNSNRIVIEDPLKGLQDLENKILRECSCDFHLDPVRLLRAYRFKVNLEMSFTKSLKKELKKVNLKYLTPFYFKSELSKTALPWLFVSEIFHDFSKFFYPYDFSSFSHYQLELNEWLNHFEALEKFSWSIALDPIMDKELKERLFLYLDLSLKRYLFFPKQNKNLINNFIETNLDKDFDEFISFEFFNELFIYYRGIVNILLKDPKLQSVIINILTKLKLDKKFIEAVKYFQNKIDLSLCPEDKRSHYHFYLLLKGRR